MHLHKNSFLYTVYALSLWCRTTAILKLKRSLIMQLIRSGAIYRKVLPCIKNECIQKLAKLLLNAVWKHWEDEKQEARWLGYSSHAVTWMHAHTHVKQACGNFKAFIMLLWDSALPLHCHRTERRSNPFLRGITDLYVTLEHWSLQEE